DTRRAVLELTGPLLNTSLGKTSYILTASEYEKGFDTEYAKNRNHEYYLALKHVLPDKSTLTFQAEYFLQERHSPNSPAPLVIDLKGTASNLDDLAIGYAKNLAGYNAYGPNSELNRGNTGFTVTYDKRLNSTWSLRAASNYYKARRWDYNQNTGFGAININAAPNAAGVVPAITTARGATPNKGLIFEDGGGLQADTLANYTLGSVKNRTLLTLDINDYYRWDPTWNYGPATNADIVAWNAVRIVTLTPDFRPAAPLQYFPKFFQWGQEQLTRLTKRRTTVFGGLLRHQSNFMNDTLLAFAGARFDRVRFRHRDWTTAATSFPDIPGYVPGTMIDRTVNELKPNLGVNYKLTSNLRIFANYSESYFVNQTDNPNVIAERGYKSEVASGYDYGFKGAFFEDRLNFTISGFYAIRENVRVSEIVETPLGSGSYVQVDRRDGDQLVRGFEADVNWRATKEISTGLSFGHVNSIFTDFGSAFPLAVGRKVNNISPENGSIYMRYTPTGRWKGFSANVGVTYVAETSTESPNAGDTYVTTPGTGARVVQRSTRQWALTVPSQTLWNLGVRYNWRSGRIDQTVALNVNNVFDRDYLRVNKQLGDRRAFYFSYTIGYGPGGR
ncbi:MAG TPA: TonB-dependent receptor, partial [Opitutaceae bacterium]